MRIIVHCSASRFGTASIIDQWHRARGWKGIGYHAVVKNGFEDASYAKKPLRVKLHNGAIETGRVLDVNGTLEWDEVGAHALGHNKDTLAVCLIGGTDSSGHFEPFTKQQVIETVKLIRLWQWQFSVAVDDVLGHCELPGVTKTCPELSMDVLRSLVRNKLDGATLLGSFGGNVIERL